jgi:hypothetical protein
MLSVRPLSEPEGRELRRQARRDVGRVSERWHTVLVSDRRYSVLHIATVFECDEATVRHLLGRFEAGGSRRCGIALARIVHRNS